MTFIDTIAKRLLQKATLIEKRQIADHTFHLTIQGNDLTNLNYVPGEHLRILVGADKSTSMQDKVRTYSVWQYAPDKATIDLAVCTHATGIGSSWVQTVSPGETVYFSGPKGKFTVDASGDYYLFVGDPSALAHLYEIRRNLPGDKKVFSLIYADRSADFFADLDGSTPFQFQVLPRNPGETVIEQLHLFIQQSQGKGILYVGGDSRLCVTLNRHFRYSLNWSGRQIKTKPFWNPLKTGLE